MLKHVRKTDLVSLVNSQKYFLPESVYVVPQWHGKCQQRCLAVLFLNEYLKGLVRRPCYECVLLLIYYNNLEKGHLSLSGAGC